MKNQLDFNDMANRPPMPRFSGQEGLSSAEPSGTQQQTFDQSNVDQQQWHGQQAYAQTNSAQQQAYDQQQAYGYTGSGPQTYDQPGHAQWQAYAQSGQYYQATAQQSVSQPKEKKSTIVLKVIAVMLVGCLGTSTFLGVLVVASLSMATASCVSSCSDSPIGDSKENARFISGIEANDRDLTTFDALAGCLESLYERRVSSQDDLTTVSDMRAALEAGSWPKLEGYGDIESPVNPQAWVRIAELSVSYLEEETGESWEVIDFAYPFPDNGPVPVPAVRDENSYTSTRVVCTNGEDKGLIAHVEYYRWQETAHFESNLNEARSRHVEARDTNELLRRRENLAGRRLMMDSRELFIWSTGEDDPLRSPEAFVALANEINADLNGLRMTLLLDDTPVTIGYDALSYDYPNDRDLVVVSFDEGCAILEASDGAFHLDCASADQLLTLFVSADTTAQVEDLTGALAPEGYTDYDGKWYAPDETGQWSDELCQAAASDLGCNEDQIIAATVLEQQDSWDSTLRAWLIVPRGVLPETPDEFVAVANHLRDLTWSELVETDDDYDRHNLYLRIYVIDKEAISDAEGRSLSFEQLRQAAMGNPNVLGDCGVDVLLGTMPSATLWSDDIEPNLYDVGKGDVGGSIARSREWRYETSYE